MELAPSCRPSLRPLPLLLAEAQIELAAMKHRDIQTPTKADAYLAL
jgi:hypothetical protein